MGKRLIITGADFTKNGFLSVTKIVQFVAKDGYYASSDGVFREEGSDYGGLSPVSNWRTLKVKCKKSNEYFFKSIENSIFRIVFFSSSDEFISSSLLNSGEIFSPPQDGYFAINSCEFPSSPDKSTELTSVTKEEFLESELYMKFNL